MTSYNEQSEIIEKARHFFTLNRPKKAIETLNTLQETPSFWLKESYWSIYAFSLMDLKRHDDAYTFITAQLHDDPSSSTLHYLLSLLFAEKGNFKDAVVNIEKALEELPENPIYLSRAAAYYIEQNQLSKSEKYLSKAESLLPEDEDIIFIRCILSFAKGENDRAEESIFLGLQLFPKSTKFLSLLSEVKSKSRPKIAEIREISLNALEEDPFDESAKDSLLFTLKNENFLVRFFVSKGFNRYRIEWSPWRIILMILFWKGVLLWGGIGLLYLMITWVGTALFYTVVRKHDAYQHIIPANALQMSNTLLIVIACFLPMLLLLQLNGADGEKIFALVSGFLFLLMTALSYFEIYSKAGKTQFVWYLGISIFLLFLWSNSPSFFGFASLFFLLVYAFFFTLNIAFK